jgi:hypothetical protein
VGYSRPIPFAVRPAVRDQIRQMLRDYILEISNSSFPNPLSVVYKENKKIGFAWTLGRRISIRFRNSISAFVRALKLALEGETDEFVVFYVDDVLVFSRILRDHLKHLDIVLSNLARAGFTSNATTCRPIRRRSGFYSKFDIREMILNWQEKRVNPVKILCYQEIRQLNYSEYEELCGKSCSEIAALV